MAAAAAGAGLLGVMTFAAIAWDRQWAASARGFAPIVLVLDVMHGGVRLGRKVSLVDMAREETRAAYVAVSDTLIGTRMPAGGLIGLVGDWLGAAVTVLMHGFLSLLAALHAWKVSEPS